MTESETEELLEILVGEKKRIDDRKSELTSRARYVQNLIENIKSLDLEDNQLEIIGKEGDNIVINIFTNHVDKVIVKFYDNEVVDDISVGDANSTIYRFYLRVITDIDYYKLAHNNYMRVMGDAHGKSR